MLAGNAWGERGRGHDGDLVRDGESAEGALDSVAGAQLCGSGGRRGGTRPRVRNVYSELESPVRYKFDALAEHLAPRSSARREVRGRSAQGAQEVRRMVEETQGGNGGFDRSVREAVLRCVPS